MGDWQLHVDESGKFEDESDTVVVAGILTPAEQPFDQEAIQTALTGLFGRWPVHAWLTRRPAALALLSGAPWAAEAIAIWQSRAAEELDRVRRALSSGEEPDSALLELLHGVLPEGEGAKLRDRADRRRSEIGQVIEEHCARAGAWLVLAAEQHPGEAVPAEGSRADRYLTLLELLLQRVVDRVAQEGQDPHRVEATVLGRDVRDPGRGMKRPLYNKLLMTLIDKLGPGPGAETRWSPPPRVRGFREPDLAAGLVVCDWCAHMARRVLMTRPVRLDDLHGELHSRHPRMGLHLPGAPALSHCTASGSAARMIAGWRLGQGDLPETGMRPWARQQAMAWSQVVRGAAR